MSRDAANLTDAAICIFLALSKTFSGCMPEYSSLGQQDMGNSKIMIMDRGIADAGEMDEELCLGSAGASQPPVVSVRLCRRSRRAGAGRLRDDPTA